MFSPLQSSLRSSRLDRSTERLPVAKIPVCTFPRKPANSDIAGGALSPCCKVSISVFEFSETLSVKAWTLAFPAWSCSAFSGAMPRWPNGSIRSNVNSEHTCHSVETVETAPATAAATAATAAAAAAVAALQQAEQQLNRILEESSVVAYPPMHIADQLVLGMGSTCSSYIPQQESVKGGATPHEPPNRVRKSLILPKLTAEHPGRKGSDGEKDCVTDSSLVALSEGTRRQKVSFMVRHQGSSSSHAGASAQHTAPAGATAAAPGTWPFMPFFSIDGSLRTL